MTRKSSISRLPLEVKDHIERLLAADQHTLDEIIRDLEQHFPELAHAGDLPSRSAVHRYGAKLDRRLAAIRASTDAARLLQANVGDDKDARSEAVMAMVQTELFEAILMLQEADEPGVDPSARIKLLSAAAKNIATLTRASINLKEFQAKIEDAARRKLLAEQEVSLQEVARAQGMDADQVDFWRRKFLGIGA